MSFRFWSKVELGSDHECWLWKAHRNLLGYGRFRTRSGAHEKILAHRHVYELVFGPIAGDLRVLHRCDQPSCVNPAHLFLGTLADNSADCVAKERQARGESNGRSKLTAAEVQEVRRLWADGVQQKDLAVRLDVHPKTIFQIVHGWTWRHV